MAQTWELREGAIRVVENAKTAALVIVGKDLPGHSDKISALDEVLERLKSRR